MYTRDGGDNAGLTIMTSAESTALQRYLQLAVIVVAAGAIYPLIYLRQNFEVTILESFGISPAQLGQCYAMLGVLFVLTYVPSGWLADRVAPRILMSFSLAAAGLLSEPARRPAARCGQGLISVAAGALPAALFRKLL